MIVSLVKVLKNMKLLSPVGVYRLLSAIRRCGINTMILLDIAEKTYGDKIALIDGEKMLSYRQLRVQSEKLAIGLHNNYMVKPNQKVAFVCRNHQVLVQSIFAVSRLGANMYLLNTEMSKAQFDQLVAEHQFDFILYDAELSELVKNAQNHNGKLVCIDDLQRLEIDGTSELKRTSMSKIVLLTGGTTGKPKKVVHQPSLFNFLNPFLTLLTRLKLVRCHTAYIATPIYHGYGIAMLFSLLALGKTVVIDRGFTAKRACTLIRTHDVQVVTVVPLMVDKMLKQGADDLASLTCIASGGAALSPKLVDEVNRQLGPVLYNLYGTSEAGLNMIATPEDLSYSRKTIGRAIEGIEIKVLDENQEEVIRGTIGQFCIKNKWSMRNSEYDWIQTGDLGYKDHNGYYFLRGRTDDMIVSAGENVYPIEVEQVLIHHKFVEDVAVIGIQDERFGERLRAFVQVNEDILTEEALVEWLRPRVARYQMPKEVIFIDEMPYTVLRKLDKKKLRGMA